MELAQFKETLSGDQPPAGLAPPLAALWHAASGDWDRAHGLVQADKSADGAWVHAYLHRVEGDLGNAAYQYRRAGQEICRDRLADEWDQIAGQLLAQS